MGLKQLLENCFDYVLYTPLVLGEGGREFRSYKFRTMMPNADEYLDEVVARNGMDAFGKVYDDPRIDGPIRGFMRRYHLDHIPELMNVLKGDERWIGLRHMPRGTWDPYYPSEHKRKVLFEEQSKP